MPCRPSLYPQPPRFPRCRTGSSTPADLPGRHPADQGGTARSHRRLRPHGRGGLRRRRAADQDRGRARSSPPGTAARRSGPSSTTPDIEAGTVPAEVLALLRRRGCLVVRGHFDREQALALGSRHRQLRRRATGSSRTTAARATTSSAASAPSPRSTRSTGRRPRCRPARATGWRGSRRSSTASGSTSPTACSGSTRTGTRCTRTASAAARRAPTRPASAPTSTRARSTCG